MQSLNIIQRLLAMTPFCNRDASNNENPEMRKTRNTFPQVFPTGKEIDQPLLHQQQETLTHPSTVTSLAYKHGDQLHQIHSRNTHTP